MEGYEGSYLPNCQTNLVIVIHELNQVYDSNERRSTTIKIRLTYTERDIFDLKNDFERNLATFGNLIGSLSQQTST